MNIKKLHQDAITPTRGSESAAGYDLYAIEDADISHGVSALLDTGIAIEIPTGFAGLIWPRSKLANKYKLQILAGVVDSDYRGSIKISVLNSGLQTVEIRKGDRIAQLVVQYCLQDELIEVDELSETGRGTKGIDCAELRR